MKWRCSLLLAVVSVAALLTARPASAQLAPTGGHYANQPTDTGFAGAVNSSGGYGASVPLDLPGARGGLPVPVQIVYGERGVGAAGLGWDVPLSYIYRDRTIAHRRPMPAVNGGWQPREAVSLMLGGRHLDLVQTASGWAARRDAPDILVRQQADGTWIVFDGQGRTYSFTVAAATGPASMWLLKSISGVGGSKLVLDYSITTPAVPGGGGLAIDLTSVSYNPHPSTANCYKNSVGLVYDADAAAPLSLSMLGDRVLVRKHKLTAVNVNSKATCGDADVRLRGYQLEYAQDVDTRQPRLERVTIVGREGSTEANTPITLAKYGYGTATSNGKLTYQWTETAPSGLTFPSTFRDTPPSSPPGVSYAMGASLLDMTGDGLPDLLSFSRAATTLEAFFDWLHTQDKYAFSDDVLNAEPIESRTLRNTRYQDPQNGDQVWRKAIDVNGDGRIDIIDAKEQPGKWVVYLNIPKATDVRFDHWERRTYATDRVAARLTQRGLSVDNDHVPLSRRNTVRDIITKHCLLWDGFAWVERPSGFQQGFCVGPPVQYGDEKTFTEWEISDLNGDGYPDVAMNSATLVSETIDDAIPEPPANPNEIQYTTISSVTSVRLPDQTQIDAMFNVLGVRVGLGSQPYGDATLLWNQDDCGLGVWVQVDTTHEKLVCGLADVNGDGMVDRVIGESVYLGTGVPSTSGFFTAGALMTLPGPLSLQQNDQRVKCPFSNPDPLGFWVRQTQGLRDLTGDGIPDYVAQQASGLWGVQIGTGSGFLPDPILVELSQFELSAQHEDCNGDVSTTLVGLFDVDGDGKPDVLDPAGSVGKLVSGGVVGAPQSGRLVTIDNGFGATTNITYRSAKLLAPSAAFSFLHQVPFPEIVVSSVETTKTGSPTATLLAKTQYSYGGAQLVFDPVRDGFRFPGYRRQVALRVPVEQVPGKQDGLATITDLYVPDNTADPYDLASGARTVDQRYARRLRLGRVSDITVLAGNLGTDPVALLAVNVTSEARRIAATHYEFDARPLATASDPPGPEVCAEMVYPYDFDASLAASSVDACRQRGFVFTTSVESLRGAPGATAASGATVTTRTETRTIDDFGRVTNIKQLGDAARTDDDLCVETSFSAPTGQNERVLSAPTTQTVTDCGGTVYAKDTWQYDELETGYVSRGLPTAHFVERRNETGVLLGEVQAFDAQFTPEANPVVVRTRREDGAFRRIAVRYDDFALAPIVLETTATGLPKQRVDLVRDPLTLNVTTSRDTNLTLHGTTFDGFGRPSMSTVTPRDGTEGALSCTTYQGFDGNGPDGRHITTKVFTDAVDPQTACAGLGRTATVFLDELGRERLTRMVLGGDYPSVTMNVNRSYDSLGRLLFVSDSYPSTQDATTAYGTTHYFNSDGTPWCVIRGKGKQTRPSTPNNGAMLTDEANEVYPTCFTPSFQDHTEVLGVRDAASLLAGSPQDGVTKYAYMTATGRLLARATWKGASRLEYETFTQDRLGHPASVTRYQDAASGSNPVTSSWHSDSWGQVVELDEPDSAAQFNLYDSWGELVEINRTHASTLKRVIQRYDALGRLTHSEHQTGGVVDPETVHDYVYDTAVQVAPQVTSTNVLGRLVKATWPTGSVTFSYDGLGRNNARVFTDAQGGLYVEKHTFSDDGHLKALDLYLADTAYADEHIDYEYDSAGRGVQVDYKNGETQNLYKATTIDPFGRVRAATYGPVKYTADYADIGRRLVNQVAVSSLLGSRSIKYSGFDPVGRERSRTETNSSTASDATTTWTYDALGRLSSAVQSRGADTIFNQQFTYDPVGNLLTMTNTGTPGATNTTLTYSTTDRDRICRVTFGADGGTACNVTYDELGSILSQPTPTGSRQYTYLVDGSVRTIADDHGSSGHFRYDAFGEVQELDLTSNISPDERQDRHYGALFTRRLEKASSSSTSTPVLTRKIPLHDGSFATRHGPGGPWTFEYGERRGNRFFTDQTGAFVQHVDYQPFGEATSTVAQPGSELYSNRQWNFGDSLAAFGVSTLGARLYDPALGRFLSRDPLLIPRTATTTNPYALAGNDPVNSSDPSGLFYEGPGPCGDVPCPDPNGPETPPPVEGVMHATLSGPTGPSVPKDPLVPLPFGIWDSVVAGGPWTPGPVTSTGIPTINVPTGNGSETVLLPMLRMPESLMWLPEESSVADRAKEAARLRDLEAWERRYYVGPLGMIAGLDCTGFGEGGEDCGFGRMMLATAFWVLIGAPFDGGPATAATALEEQGLLTSTRSGVALAGNEGTRVFSRGTGGIARVTLDEARAAAQAHGIDMRMFELAYESGPNFGFFSQTGSGALWRAPNGRIVLTLQDAGLASVQDAVETISHELNHVRGVLANGVPSSEEAAEAAAIAARPFIRR